MSDINLLVANSLLEEGYWQRFKTKSGKIWKYIDNSAKLSSKFMKKKFPKHSKYLAKGTLAVAASPLPGSILLAPGAYFIDRNGTRRFIKKSYNAGKQAMSHFR